MGISLDGGVVERYESSHRWWRSRGEGVPLARGEGGGGGVDGFTLQVFKRTDEFMQLVR